MSRNVHVCDTRPAHFVDECANPASSLKAGDPLCTDCAVARGMLTLGHRHGLRALTCAGCGRSTWFVFAPADVVLDPPTMPGERLADRLVADIAGALVMLREPCYGGVQLTDDQVWERSRAIAARLLVTYHVEELADVMTSRGRT